MYQGVVCKSGCCCVLTGAGLGFGVSGGNRRDPEPALGVLHPLLGTAQTQ